MSARADTVESLCDQLKTERAEHVDCWEEARKAIDELYRTSSRPQEWQIVAILERFSKPAAAPLSDPVDSKGDAAGERGEVSCIRCALAVGITPGSLCAEHSQGAPILESKPTVVDGGSPKGSGEPKPEPVVEPPQNGEVCRSCKGSGVIYCSNEECPECHGDGYYWKDPSPTADPDAKGDGE